MLVSEVINLAKLQVEEEYADSNWLKYINEALDDITPIAKIVQTATITNISITNDTGSITISSSADLVTAHEIINLYFTRTTPVGGTLVLLPRIALSDLLSVGWKNNGSTITFKCGDSTATVGTATINYYKKLQYVSTVTDDLATTALLPVQYHDLLVHYCIAKSQQKEEEFQDKQDAFTDYLRGRQRMALERIWEMEPHNRAFIKQARLSIMVGGSK